MPEPFSDTTSPHDASGKVIAEAERRFQDLVKEMDLQSALKELDKAASLGPFSVKIAFHTASPERPARHIAYVQSERTPRKLAPNAVHGWKIQEGFWWEYSAAGKTIDVCIVGRDALQLQSVVGACMSTQRVNLTHGLIVRNLGDNNMRWGLTVGHGFADVGRHAANQVIFCDLVNGAQCQYCVGGQCANCDDPNRNVSRSAIAAGINEIVTMNPQPSPVPDGWVDLGAYKIPPNHIIQPLAIRNVLNNIANLHDQGALAAVAGLNNVGTSPIRSSALQVLVNRPQGVFLFKKGKSTGWTFGKLELITPECIVINPLGGAPQAGDCGAIWFAIDGAYARPAAYQVAVTAPHTPDPGKVVAYAWWAAWPAFAQIAGMPLYSIGFNEADSYVW